LVYLVALEFAKEVVEKMEDMVIALNTIIGQYY
jgi:hypothetical protein